MLLRELGKSYLAQIGRSKREYRRLCDHHIYPHLGERDVASIGVKDVYQTHQRLAKTPYQANRVLAILSGHLRHAERLELRPIGSNPCSVVKAFPEKRRHRYMTAKEALAVGKVLEEAQHRHPEEVLFLRLLMLTGARPDEIKRARWDDIVHDAILLDRHKTDRYGRVRVIYLAPVAKQLLADATKRNALICGGKNPRRVWDRVRDAAGCPSLRMYDLRHSFASAGLTAGASLAQIGPLLGHASVQTTAGYAHLVNATARDVANRAAEVMQGMLAGTAA